MLKAWLYHLSAWRLIKHIYVYLKICIIFLDTAYIVSNLFVGNLNNLLTVNNIV